ncbi:hypothetical protein CVT24_010518 [Panaeolus cyanescens]|uniref:Uncharacterized protein n=1 Tax=Panaeolus cyanescens TaxID=181874 RepID=A0A409WDG7_9AGAR|nr:hypothetical protein CVT24_010518 [Panaeolus cyanescens]
MGDTANNPINIDMLDDSLSDGNTSPLGTRQQTPEDDDGHEDDAEMLCVEDLVMPCSPSSAPMAPTAATSPPTTSPPTPPLLQPGRRVRSRLEDEAPVSRPNEGSSQLRIEDFFVEGTQRLWVEEIEESLEEEREQQAAERNRITAMQRRAEREDRASRARYAQQAVARQRLQPTQARDRAATRVRRRPRTRNAPHDDDPPPAYHTLFPDR